MDRFLDPGRTKLYYIALYITEKLAMGTNLQISVYNTRIVKVICQQSKAESMLPHLEIKQYK